MIFIGILINPLGLRAQFKINTAVDTIHNKVNKQAINTLYQYLNTRKANKDAKSFWIESEVRDYKRYDFNDEIIGYGCRKLHNFRSKSTPKRCL